MKKNDYDDYIWRMEHTYWDDRWDDKIEQKMAENLYGDWLTVMSPEQADMYYTWAFFDMVEKQDREENELAQAIAEREAA